MLERVLKRSAYRKPFFIIISLLAAILILLRYIALPLAAPTVPTGYSVFLQQLLEGVLISLIVTVGVGGFIFWLVPDLDEIANVSVIGANEIGEQLSRAMHNTDVWWFMGGTGRYFRSVALKTIAEGARKGTSSCHVVGLVLDPTNVTLCEAYAKYRMSLQSGDGEDWSVGRVQAEVLATLLSALQLRDSYPQLRVELGLRGSFSTFRYDLSSSHVIITKEDPQSPAIRCSSPGYYYSAYRGEITFAHNQAKLLPAAAGLLGPGTISLESGRSALEANDVDLSSISENVIEQAVQFASKSKNPYG